ncbi:hypothetical protein EJV47_21505 [Hymenobacter gummosus]|uniref:STAS/SEC14 domain-containing protein n=1 Tax=Hymenobacter gummosus TaxID=1776032 RepID=A0A3S0IKG9_9BACT|nr:hypothetical protein [Hymenobacter gummosus]RTQ46531.1 hypothetical protein EJV47_21505 [Hymenobacter gummosus]
MTTSASPAAASLIFDNPAGRIWHHPEGFVRLEWHRAPGSESHVRDLYKATTDALGRFGFTRVLSDHRHMPPLSPGLQRWLSDTWVPETMQATGYHRGAVIQAFNLFNRMATNQIVSQLAGLPLHVAHFDNEQEAERWLLSDLP